MPAHQNSDHSADTSATADYVSHRASHRARTGGRDFDRGRAGSAEAAAAANEQAGESHGDAAVYSDPNASRESQGAQQVVLADLPVGLPFEQRVSLALQHAQEAFAQTGYWVAFYKAILGAEGVVNRLFPKLEELDLFYATREFAEIQKILTALRASDAEKADAIEPLKMITIRIPRSMQGALINESKRHGTSINKLCITKLLRPIEAQWVPQEKGNVKGRKPQA